MKRKYLKRLAVFVVTLALTTSFVLGMSDRCFGASSGVEMSVDGEATVPGGKSGLADPADEDGDILSPYEKNYIRQHLDYCDSWEYKAIRSTSGMLAQDTALAYNEAGLNAANRTWDQLSSFFVLIGGGQIDEGLTNSLEITNKYDIPVSYLMQTTASEDSFSESYEAAYLNATVDMLNDIKSLVSDTSGLAGDMSEGSLGKVEEMAGFIDQVIVTIEDFKGTTKAGQQALYKDALDEIKNKIKTDFIEEDQEILAEGIKSLKAARAVAQIGTETYSDVIDACILYNTCVQATDVWCESWRKIGDSARKSGTDESKLLAESIERILGEIESAKEDMAISLVTEALKSVAGNTAVYAVNFLSDAWDKMADSWTIGKAIRQGLLAGVTVSNVITNCDDIAYFGEMLISAGILAAHGWNVLTEAEEALEERGDFQSALAFDEIFNIYKEIQIAACDYAINYYQAIITAPPGYIFKYTNGDEIAAQNQILAQKAKWMAYQCHGEEGVIVNNGGRFVSYDECTYYWRFAPGSVEETGILGNFNRVGGVNNDLICRKANGEETVVIQDTGTGPIFISGDRIYYEKGIQSWGVCEFNGTPVTTYDAISILAAVPQQQSVIAFSDDKGIFAIEADGTQTVLAPKNASFIGISGNNMYYGAAEENIMDIRSIGLDGQDQAPIGTITLPESSQDLGAICFGDILTKDDAFYVTCGFYGGSGGVFSDGGIYRISREGGVETLLDPSGSQQVNFPKIYIQNRDDGDVLYYYCGDGYMNAGSWDTWVSQDVYSLNLETGETKAEDFILSNIGDAVCVDGRVQTLVDDSGQYREILSAETADSLGYTDIGDLSGESETFVADLDIVGDMAYFTITKMTKDSSLDVGWRTGYRRDPMRTYVTQIGSGNATLLNEY